MANEEHLKLARQGKDAWNKWRRENPNEPADFSGVNFTEPANHISFEGFEFGNGVIFQYAKFGDLPRQWQPGQPTTGGAVFTGAKFGNDASFEDAKFGKYANFNGTVFGNDTRFDGVTFEDGASFDGANFGKGTRFDDAIFRGMTGFTNARFNHPPNFFANENGLEHLSFVGTQFWTPRGILRWTSDFRIITNLRHLRGIASKIHATDIERDLFLLERQAERGVFWKNLKESDWKSRPLRLWQFLAAVFLFSIYRASSSCGRSVFLPTLWFLVLNFLGFFNIYRSFTKNPICCDAYSYLTFSGVFSLREWPLISNPVCDSILSFTLANLIPFGEMSKVVLAESTKVVFGDAGVPPFVHLITLTQGATNTLLLFLLALALRNHFKVK